MAANLHVELCGELAAHGTARHARRRLSSAGSFKDVSGITPIVFKHASQIRVTRTRAAELPAPLTATGGIWLNTHDFFPVHPIAIPDQERNWRTERLSSSHSGNHLHFVRLELHPRASAVTRHPPPQLQIDVFSDYRQSSGNSFQNRYESLPVRFACSSEPNHLVIRSMCLRATG
jgi:hypothetical protein